MGGVRLVDDHELIREGLRRALEREADVEVIAEAASVAEGIAMARKDDPTVAIVDLRLPDGNGLDVVRALREQSADMGIVVLTMYAGDNQLF
ncbi:MAG: response regulator, partial [Phycisphaerales bacterium]